MGRFHICALVLIAGCGRLGFEDEAPGGGGGGGGDDVAAVAHITINRTGTMPGTIMGSNTFSCNTSTCTLDVPIGTSVWFRGVAGTDAWFAGWSGPCGGTFNCELDVMGDLTIGAEFAALPNRVFVTSTRVDGAFGGIAAADAICQARAVAGSLTGTFIAYLSDATTDAETRIASSRGWVRVDGAPFADAPTAFGNGKIIFPPRLDESGNDVGNIPIFTGTSAGVKTTHRCLDWTSNAPTDEGGITRSELAAVAAQGWDDDCDLQAGLLCVETGRVVPIAIHPDPQGYLAFASRTDWVPGSGRASADAVCANDAMAAGIPGTFLAGVATTTESIESRFPANRIYRRVDGVRLLRGPGIFSTDYLDVPPELDSLGDAVNDDFWTGTLKWNAPAQLSQNCSDWSDGSAGIDGEMDDTAKTDLRSSAKREPCDSSIPVLCFEN